VRKLALIGLDCADPVLLAELLPGLPTLRELAASGSFARLRSVDPPITIPAWMCMMTGKDPGELGVYGFRNRKDTSYAGLGVASSASFSAPAVWDLLGERGLRSILIGVPGTYPPKPVKGLLVSCFLTPNAQVDFTYPAALREKVAAFAGEYLFDAREFRTEDKARLVEEVVAMTKRRFALVRGLVSTEPWDFLATVEIGLDRMHHALFAHHDPRHPRHDPASHFRDALREYYQLLDQEIAALLSDLPSRTRVLVVSDHGVQRLEGGIALNDWLIRAGYLALKADSLEPGTRLGDLVREGLVDWSRTSAWGEGGYYGRIFLNVAGREPEGVVPPSQVDEVRTKLAHEIEAIPDEEGRPLGTRVLRPEELYREVRGIAPDLLVYFGDLRFRSIGTLGWGRIHLRENDTGPDDANHAPYGIFIDYPSEKKGGDRSILEVKDLILAHFDEEAP
jgi:predicted AlkP superfamily phosphohydrolase/phosphomutase